MDKEILTVVDVVSAEKGVSKDIIFDALEAAADGELVLGVENIQDLVEFGGFRGVSRRVGGPIASQADDVLRLTLGNLYQAIEGQETRFGIEALRFTQRNMPGGTIWYSRLAFERAMDQALTFFEPIEGRRALKRKENRFKNERQQGFWWRPGTTSPQRGPEFGGQ